MPFAELNGKTIHYDVRGDGEPLLCIHGLGVDARGWSLQIEPWSARHRMVVFDNRDVGQSSYVDEQYSTADMAEDALALADHLELERFHLLGISLGGMIAQHVALAAPERVRTLTIAFSHSGVAAEYGEIRGRLLGRTMTALTPDERVDQLMLLCYTEEFFQNRPAVEFLRAAILSNPHPQDPAGFERQAMAGSRHDLRGRLGRLAMPVHVIGARRDVLIPVWKSEETADLIPQATLTIMEDVGHGAMWERAEDFNRIVLEFLATSPSEAVR